MSILKTTEAALTADVVPAMGNFLTKKVDIFGASIPLNKKVTKVVVELVAVAVLAIGVIGTQVYVYADHKKAIELNSARVGTVEAYQKQTDTNFVAVNSAITATDKLIAVTDAKVASLAAKLAADEAKLTPVRPTSAVTRKYYRKR